MNSPIKQYLTMLVRRDVEGAIALLDNGLTVAATYGPRRLTPLHLVSTADEDWAEHVITELVRRGARLDHPDKGGHTPLHQAAWRTARIPVQVLLRHGASVNAQNGLGQTPLYKAVTSFNDPRSSEVIRMLIASGADPSIPSSSGGTPISLAKRFGVVLPEGI